MYNNYPLSSILTCNLIYVMSLPVYFVYVLFHNQSDCGELCISFNPYSFFEINNFFKFTCIPIVVLISHVQYIRYEYIS